MSRKNHTGKIYGINWIKTTNIDEYIKDCLVFNKAYPESTLIIPFQKAIHMIIRTILFNQR